MRPTEAAVLRRLDALIAKGDSVAQTAELVRGISPARHRLDNGLYANWWTQSVHALTSLLGQTSNYTQAFVKQVSESAWLSELEIGMGILKAVREDAAEGHLFATTAGLISGEIFSDFLDMADHLLGNQYLPVAASLTGAVLEDALRRIADSHDISHNKGDGLSSLNAKCVKAGVYNAIVQREVQLWTDIRNSADHGNFGDFTEVQVQDMHRGVSRFLAEHL